MTKADWIPVTVLSDQDKRILAMKYHYDNRFHQMALTTLIMHETNEYLIEFMVRRINPYYAYEVVIEYACGPYPITLAQTAFNRLQLLRHYSLQLELEAYEEVRERAHHFSIRSKAVAARGEPKLGNIIPFPRRK